MGLPLFSIVLSTYNRSTLLQRAVRSILAQTVNDRELIIVDDVGPEPATVTVDDRRIRVVRRAVNGGLAASRNTGIEESRGTYVAFLDDDDLYTPDRLELARQGLQHAPITVCWSRYFFEPPGWHKRVLPGNVHDEILDAITPHTAATVVERGVIVPFDESYEASQDVEWWLRVSRQGPVATTPEVGYLIRQHDGPRHRNTRRARIDASIRLMNEHHPAYFAEHPRAAAFRWKRVGIQAMAPGDRSLARRAFARSFARRPTPRSLFHLARSATPRPTPAER